MPGLRWLRGTIGWLPGGRRSGLRHERQVQRRHVFRVGLERFSGRDSLRDRVAKHRRLVRSERENRIRIGSPHRGPADQHTNGIPRERSGHEDAHAQCDGDPGASRSKGSLEVERHEAAEQSRKDIDSPVRACATRERGSHRHHCGKSDGEEQPAPVLVLLYPAHQPKRMHGGHERHDRGGERPEQQQHASAKARSDRAEEGRACRTRPARTSAGEECACDEDGDQQQHDAADLALEVGMTRASGHRGRVGRWRDCPGTPVGPGARFSGHAALGMDVYLPRT